MNRKRYEWTLTFSPPEVRTNSIGVEGTITTVGTRWRVPSGLRDAVVSPERRELARAIAQLRNDRHGRRRVVADDRLCVRPGAVVDVAAPDGRLRLGWAIDDCTCEVAFGAIPDARQVVTRLSELASALARPFRAPLRGWFALVGGPVARTVTIWNGRRLDVRLTRAPRDPDAAQPRRDAAPS